MADIKWINGAPGNPTDEAEFLTWVPYRRSGDLQFCRTRASLKRQINANRGEKFRLYRKIPGTFNYELVAVLSKIPLSEHVDYSELDDFIDDLLA